MPTLKPAVERVLDKVVAIPFAGCWVFMGATNSFGYGIVGSGGRGKPNDRAHRITYKHFKGEIPKGMFVCHTCDVPSCCNPDHLFLGTNQDNVNDMVRKKRNSKPPRNPHVVGLTARIRSTISIIAGPTRRRFSAVIWWLMLPA
jgi:hypothetical protein